MRPSLLFFRSLVVALAAAAAAAGCGGESPQAAAPRPEVGVVRLAVADVPMVNELPGRVSALRVAEVRARVDGIVLRREFTEGSDVQAGQLLYKIDPAPYQAARDSAAAALAKAEANLVTAKLLAQRRHALIETNAVSRQDYDNAVASRQQAQADVAAAKAALRTAQINLGYTDVVAPIDGRIGKSMITEGAYVRQSEATLLATVQQLDSIYVDVSQSSAELLRLRNEFEGGRLERLERAASVELLLEDGSLYPERGTLQFSDITVEPNTGTFALRALFPNANQMLLPGMFVRARVTAGIEREALLVPQQAVSHDLKGEPTALVVGEGETVELRKLTVKRSVGNRWLVSAGLRPGDRVVVDGFQRIRPGVQVAPVEAGGEVAQAGAPADRR